MRSRPRPIAVILSLLLVGFLVAVTWRATAQEDAKAGPAEAAEPAQKKEQPEWEKNVDKFFGDYLVSPFMKVLFFDFWTSRWLFPEVVPEVKCPKCGTKFNTIETWGDSPSRVEMCPECGEGKIVTTKGTKVPMIVFWLLIGAIFFTLRMGFINFRAFRHAIRLIRGDYDNPEETGEVSHFQALASALSATIGLGNIAGVAIAVGTGGPGAIFWMIVAGLLGMSSKFAECSLSQMYRDVAPDGTISGGPMHYLREGLKDLSTKLGPLGSVLAVLFALLCIGGSFGGGCTFQIVQSLGAVREGAPWLDKYPWIYGVVMAVMVGIVIIGGIRRIAATAEKIVPLMCIVYVATTIYILIVNYAQIGDAFRAIFAGAFTPVGIKGGILGVMVVGIRRASFSNEAGIGSAAIAHAAAKTEEPIREGIVASLGPFIDTVIICTMTGLAIIITGVAGSHPGLVTENRGAALTVEAFRTVNPWFPYILYVAVVLFAYSTMISWSYYGERCWSHLFGRRTAIAYKLLFLVFIVLGSVVTATKILDFSDLMILAMAFPNILGVMMLSGKIKEKLDDYWGRYKSGEMQPYRK